MAGLQPITPNMNQRAMAAAISNNFSIIEQESRTKIVRDETGTKRIILGRMPDGTYGLLVSKPGVDVDTLFTT